MRNPRLTGKLGWPCFILFLLGSVLLPQWLPTAPHTRSDVALGASKQDRIGKVAENNFTVAPPESTADPDAKVRIDDAYARLPMQFEANEGQLASEVKFVSRGGGYTLFLTPTEAVLSLKTRKPESEVAGGGLANKQVPLSDRLRGAALPSTEVVRMKLVGANQRAPILGADELPGKVNYFIGNDPKKWRTNISTYQKVSYQGVYPGVDLIYYGNQRQLEYDFVVAPQADPRTIKLAFDGAQQLRIDANGELVFKTKTGEEVRQHKPVLYQEIDGSRKAVRGNYVLHEGNQVGFEVQDYDQTKSLVIDPTLLYSTYLGGSGDDSGVSVAVDSSGSAYVLGQTGSTNFPLLNPKQAAFGGGATDAFVTKLSPGGSSLVYSTYLGGSSIERPTAIAIDSSGNAYVTGETDSTNFPLVSPRQPSAAGGGDGFVAKLSSTGSALVYSTYHGGSGYDEPRGIAVDSGGNAYVGGYTVSTNFPTASAIQTTNHGGTADGFLTKLNAAGSALVYSTYLGGTNEDLVFGVALDSSAQAYVVGGTVSTDFPTFLPLRPSNAGSRDAFVSKVTAAGTAFVFSTYLGGSASDWGNAVAVDSLGAVYVTGATQSTNFPTLNPIQGTLVGTDAFLTKLNSGGSGIGYSTFLGGSGFDWSNAIAVDSSGNAYVGGYTQSSNFPTVNAPQSIAAETSGFDGFVTKINNFGNAYVYSSYYGGTGLEHVNGIAANANGAYIVGDTAAVDFPIVSPALQSAYGGGFSDAFVARISEATNTTYYAIRGHLQYFLGSPVVGAPMQLSGTLARTAATTANGNYIFQLLPAGGNFTVTPPSVLVASPTQYTYPSLAFNETVANFVSNQLVQIGGKITNVNGRGLSGITVTLSGSGSATTQTNSNGNYSFSVAAGGNYTVTPSDPHVNASGGWLPSDSISHTNLTQDVINDNFSARFPSFTVAGAVKKAGGTVFPSVTVTLSGGASANYTTNSIGKYTSDQLNVLGDYTFTPQPFSAGGITYNSFSPANYSFVSILACNQGTPPPGVLCSGFDYTTVDFTAIPAPTVVTSAANPVAAATATLNGTVNPNGLATNGWFEWGTDPALNSFTATTTQAIGSGTTNQPITANLSGLIAATPYFFRAVGSSTGGTVKGSILTFTTSALPRTLTVASTNPAVGVSITVTPNDNNAAGNGPTQFTRTYNNNQVVSLAAPITTLSGNSFQKWLKDGADFANNTLTNVSVTMDANHTMTAVYLTPTTTLTVASTNPASGVNITVSPNDNNAAGNGATQFTRTYNINTVVSLTAPAAAGGNNFQKWLKDGADFANNTLANASVTMDATHTMTAVYVASTTIQFSSATYNVSETGPRVDVTVTRSGDTTGAASVNFVTNDNAGLTNCNVFNGIASPRCDYTNTGGTLSWAAGDASSKSFSVAIVDDAYAEGSETFTVGLNSPSGATLGTQSTATVTITDNEGTNGANPIDNTNFFVRQQYIDFLGREPDPPGLAGWTATINNCSGDTTQCDRIHVSQLFFQSAEFQDRGYFVYRFCPVALGRKPDYSEFVADLASVSGFLDANQLEAAKVAFIAGFMARTAFANTYNPLTNQQYVDALLNTAGVTLSSRQTMINGLNGSTLTRAQVLRQIVESTEVSTKYNHQAYAVMEYFGYLRRQPDSFYLQWIQVLDQSNDPRGMVTGFATSAEYRQRFGP